MIMLIFRLFALLHVCFLSVKMLNSREIVA